MKKKIIIFAVALLVVAGAFLAKGYYYTPGTYIKVSMSKTITLGVEIVEESSVPQIVLEKIQELGTKVG
jgi:hypothetical protein